MSRRVVLALAALLVGLGACGDTAEVREPDVVVRGAAPDAGATATAVPRRRGVRVAAARIVVVTHGQASDPFWAIVRRGIDAAAREHGVAVSYRAPDTYDVRRMRRLADAAVDDRPDGLVLSLPDAKALAPVVRRAVRARIPVVSINSGSDESRRLGILAHVGQPEWRAGYESGRRLAAAGVRRGVCINQEVGNAGLDVRCRAFAAALRRSGARATVLPIPLQDPGLARRRILRTLTSSAIDGVLTLGPAGAAPVLAVMRARTLGRRMRLATFDLSPEILRAVKAGRMLFAVDQQPYLQGYLPVVLLAERARHGLAPAAGELIATGPNFVTGENAARVMALSRRGIR